jgi:hypothetical protein
MSPVQIYLAKAGVVSGPYTEKEIESMRSSGELTNYSWISKGGPSNWQALDPMPALPGEPERAAAPVAEPPRLEAAQIEPPRRASQPAPSRRSLRVADEVIEGVCHDYRSMVSGQIVQVTESGCELLVVEAEASSPKFTSQAKVYLNLLNSKNGNTIDIAAKLLGVTHSRQGWTYRLEWESVPELFRVTA